MNTWKDAWVIFSKDLRIDRMYLIWNVIFMIYSGGMISMMIWSRDESGVRLLDPMADYLILMTVPMIGFYFSRRSFSYIKEDSYTKMLLYYKTLPIPAATIMKSRIIQLVTAMLFNGFIYFATIYLVFMGMGDKLSFDNFLALAITWIGYATALNGPFIYFELSRTGRVYLWLTFAIMLAVCVLAFIVAYLGGNILNFTMESSKRYGLLSPVMWGVLAGGIFMLALFCKLTLRKLGMRDLER
ncbi:hypothetical protein [Paenibacillus sp. DYY-L-2]|uniref:hypothetical protein n=1 Tax=Paenibacillus sp. DYY-L-2 TaxID=3447013 RepID=UPI003F4F75ED